LHSPSSGTRLGGSFSLTSRAVRYDGFTDQSMRERRGPMRTQQRLTEAYERARVVPFTNDSRFVFISDCHRGTGSLADEFTRNENSYVHALDYYYTNGFTYVEVGDGDELWEHSHFRHIKDAHYNAFDAVKRFHYDDRFILIWGNHNNFLRDPEYVKENLHVYRDEYTGTTHPFLPGIDPCESVVFIHETTGQEIVVLHGHQGDFANDQAWWPTMLAVRYFWRHVHGIGVRNPVSPVRNAYKRHKIERHFTKWIERHKRALICGHTHRFKYPRNGEQPYFNAGACVYPTKITAVEVCDGTIALVRWCIVADGEGSLRVAKDVLWGPDPIEKFDMRQDL